MKFFKQKKVNKIHILSFKQIGSKEGFTLVETLVAISIFSLAVIALMSVLGSGISDIAYAKKKIIAGYLAQEGIESIRNMRDTYVLYPINGGWSLFRAKLNPCNFDDDCGFDNSVSSVTDNDFIFKCNLNRNSCKLFLDNGNYNTNSSGNDSGFTRKIWMNVISLDSEVKVFSKVEWEQGSGTFDITFSENLFNWVEE